MLSCILVQYKSTGKKYFNCDSRKEREITMELRVWECPESEHIAEREVKDPDVPEALQPAQPFPRSGRVQGAYWDLQGELA